MDGMSGMSGTGGMDEGAVGMFQSTNMSVARVYWYIIAATVAVLSLRRVVEQTRFFKINEMQRTNPPIRIASSPGNWFTQSYETTIALCREMSYPQPYWMAGRFARYFNPPALGRCLLMFVYWAIILSLLWSNTILSSSSEIYGYKWEIVGFRAAWVSVTQVPLIYCLSCKFNVISLLTGISYERLNWLHRWVSRTLFLTVIVHWSFFFREWWLANFVEYEIELMPMVTYGFAAWAVMGWMLITGFGFFRSLAYEIWVAQHILAAYILIWLLYVHVPAYARYNIWLSIAFVALDRGVRMVLSLTRNLHIRSFWNKASGGDQLLGFHAQAEALGNDYVRLIIKDVDFTWKPGQHVFISCPNYGILESHPFTIASEAPSQGCVNNELKLYFKAHAGLTRKLLDHSRQQQQKDLRVFLSGPWGTPPLLQVSKCDSLLLFATSTGASFAIPHLLYAVQRTSSVQRVRLYWIVRHKSQLDWFKQEILSALEIASDKGIDASCIVFITDKTLQVDVADDQSSFAISEKSNCEVPDITADDESVKHKSLPITSAKSVASQSLSSNTSIASVERKNSSVSKNFTIMRGRPRSLDHLVRPVVEDSMGETAILACGGAHFMSQLRNYTAALSDERAVHKGTGAQGIYLFTETYGW